MAQVKKIQVRDAILESASALFMEQGYADTKMTQIARGAGVTPSNVYVYFNSKIDLLYALYGPWLSVRLSELEEQAAAEPDPKKRLRLVLLGLWRDIPNADNGFAHNLMQAISITPPNEGYSRDMLLESERRVSAMVRGCLPDGRQTLLDDDLLSHMLFMAFDGFTLNVRLVGKSRRVERIVDEMVSLLLGG